MLRAIIIDDEPPARKVVHRLLEAHPEIVVVGEAGNVTAARRRLRKAADYDLVFLDIQLIGGSGFDLVPDVTPSAHIIFFTGEEKHALRAFEINALDYLLKPVEVARFAQAIKRLLSAKTASTSAPDESINYLPADSVLVRGESGSEFVALNTIAAIEAQQNYTRLFLANGREVLVLRSLTSWETALPNSDFVSIHRSTIINLKLVTAVNHQLMGPPQLQLQGRVEPICPSRRKWAQIRNLITIR